MTILRKAGQIASLRGLQVRGFTIVEVMVSLTIGLLLMTGVVVIFQSATRSQNELEQSGAMIQNGSTAIRLLGNDIAHAGFYGQLYVMPVAASSLPDPCSVLSVDIYPALAYAVQGFDAPVGSPLACLLDGDFVAGTDVLVLRRAGFDALSATDKTISGWPYIQATSFLAEVQTGGGVTIGADKNAQGAATALFRKDGSTAAEIRPMLVRIYFIAPCSLPADGGTRCTGAADDGGRPVPTLKMLELASTDPTWTITALVEGIEDMQIEYGIDSLPVAVNSATGAPGDGVADSYLTSPALADWPNVVAIKVRLLARTSRLSSGHVDIKTYDMGQAGVRAAQNDGYKRHLFSGMFRLNNVAGRREIPQ